MPFRYSQNAIIFYFENLHRAGLVHGVFARQGGVSPSPWHSLNTGSRVGDAPANVGENLVRAARLLQRSPETMVGVRQVHGDAVHRVDRLPASQEIKRHYAAFDSPEALSLPEADAIITQNPDATLFMRFADCVPVLLFDPVKKAVGIAHAGWRGTVNQVAARTVEQLAAQFDSDPANIMAGIGPSICVDHYEVGQTVVDEVKSAFGMESVYVLRQGNGRSFFDLWEANRRTLLQAGVKQIEMSSECTAEKLELWFSHRGEKGRTGRFVAIAGLQVRNDSP